MNPTIEKIVNLLFEDLVETDETFAIREEILHNCQDRYQDLRDAGISEDDAIHAVVDSLNGMEEMLSEYPRKESQPQPGPEADAQMENKEPGEWSYDPARSPIREIRLSHMGNVDVEVEASFDDLIHVECDNTKLGLMTAVSDGVLSIGLSESPEPHVQFSADLEFDLKSIGRLFEKICRKFTALTESGTLTLSIPDSLRPVLHIGTASGNVTIGSMHLERLIIGSASGDVELDSIAVQTELRVSSASGDITVSGSQAQQMQLSSTSGDIEASNCMVNENVRLNTTSGDIGWCRQCTTLNASSISGDITLEGSAESISFHTVSGDVEISPANGHPLAISGNTTSGDVSVYLPKGTHPDVSCNTVSGDIHNHAGSMPGAPVTVKISTVSGDIEVN